MSGCQSLRALLLCIAGVGVLVAGGVHAQVEPPPIPLVSEDPPVTSDYCPGGLDNPNYDAWDPCCKLGGRPSYCPETVANPFDFFEPGIENAFRTLLLNMGLADMLGNNGTKIVNWAANYLAGEVVSAAMDFVEDLLNGGGTGAGVMTVPSLSSQFAPSDRLTSIILTTIAAISDDPLLQIKAGAAYRLQFVAGPTIKDVCQETRIHRKRSFDLGVMNGTSNNGLFTFTTQAGVPTEIKANRPSWVSRQIFDFRWAWWFGDGVMVPQSAKHDAYTVHTYPFIGEYTLSFVMLKEDKEFWISYNSGSGFWPRTKQTGRMFSDACNYGTMQVVENRRPVANFRVGPTNIAWQLRFTAGSSDSDGNPLSYLWVFEDGSTTRARTFTKTYPPQTSRVVETVQLTVSDGAKMHTTTRTITAMPSSCERTGPLDRVNGGVCADVRNDPVWDPNFGGGRTFP